VTTQPLSSPPVPVVIPPATPRRGIAALASAWVHGWLAVTQLVLDFVLAPFYLVLVLMLALGVGTTPVVLIGAPLVAVCLLGAMVVAMLDRARIRAFTGVHVPPSPPPPRDRPAWRRYLFDARPWKAGLHTLLISLWGLVAGLAVTVLTCAALALTALPAYRGALPGGRFAGPGDLSLRADPAWALVGVFALLVLPLVARGLVRVDVLLARGLLGGGSAERVRVLAERVQTLDRTRVETVDSVEGERRRIERDLHDGPQQRLVAIAMDLGMARERIERDPDGARELLDKAHSASKEAITEMRHVARGIHPPVLTDRGLDAALSALAAGSPVPVTIDVDLPRRPGATVEAIAYFCVSEALTNVAKHARAGSARVAVRLLPGEPDGALQVTVQDDGVGGADPTGGTGLIGLRQRVAAVDGTLHVDSPPGGPTVLTATLPVPVRSTS